MAEVPRLVPTRFWIVTSVWQCHHKTGVQMVTTVFPLEDELRARRFSDTLRQRSPPPVWVGVDSGRMVAKEDDIEATFSAALCK
jgi:hypothetical protein